MRKIGGPLWEATGKHLLTSRLTVFGRVEMWRGGCRLNISVAAPFVWRCLSGSAMAPFPHPAHRTGQADFPHPALGQDFTLSRATPSAAPERITSLISSRRISLPRKGCRVDLRIVLFEDCSAFTRVAACTLALSPIRDTLIEGFSHFVTSMTASIASGWSGCRVGLAPTGRRRLSTAQTQLGHYFRL